MSSRETKKEKTQRGEGYVRRGEENGLMQTQAKEYLQLPEAVREKEGFSLRAFREITYLLRPGSLTSGVQNFENKILLF